MQKTNSSLAIRRSMDLLAKAYYQLDSVFYEREDYSEMQDGATATIIKEGPLKGVLKIVVNEFLLRPKQVTHEIRRSWIGKITKALLPVEIRFPRAICIIVNYSPTKTRYDNDNRYYNLIINALRFAKIIQDDDYHNLSFMVTGAVDPSHPRTEIFVINTSEEKHMFAYKMSEIVSDFV